MKFRALAELFWIENNEIVSFTVNIFLSLLKAVTTRKKKPQAAVGLKEKPQAAVELKEKPQAAVELKEKPQAAVELK
jgi:hypothetical protein